MATTIVKTANGADISVDGNTYRLTLSPLKEGKLMISGVDVAAAVNGKADKTEVVNALALKADITTVNEIKSEIGTIPTKVSDLTQDVDYVANFEKTLNFGTVNGTNPKTLQEYITAVDSVMVNLEEENF